jgi:hypothetical protein
MVIATLSALLALSWYPPTYVWAMGGQSLIAILVGVDIILGPLLTLIVWNMEKPSLRFDMAVIVLLQMLALGYGLYSMFWARPVYMVFAIDRFDLVTAAAIPTTELKKVKREEFRSLPLTGPEIVAVQSPSDGAERTKILFSAVSGGIDLPQLPQYYVPYSEMAAEAVRKALPLDSLLQRDAATRSKLLTYLEGHKLDQAKLKFLPLQATQNDQTVLLDSATGAILDIVDIDPWLQTATDSR